MQMVDKDKNGTIDYSGILNEKTQIYRIRHGHDK
jgi:hypothetical protein